MALAQFIRCGVGDFSYAASFYGVDADEVRWLYFEGVQWWERLKPFFEGGRVEAEHFMRRGNIQGTADVIAWLDGDCLRVLDWKSGYVLTDAWHQCSAYAWLGEEEIHGLPIERIECFVVWLRHGHLDKEHYTPEQLAKWRGSLDKDVLAKPKTYRAGDQCEYCRKRPKCRAFGKYLMAASDCMGNVMDAAHHVGLGAVYARAKQLKSAITKFDKIIALRVKTEGSVDLGDGTQLVQGMRDKTTMDLRKAWTILTDNFTADELVECMSASLSKFKKLCPDKAHREFLMSALEDAGAIETKSAPHGLKIEPIEQPQLENGGDKADG